MEQENEDEKTLIPNIPNNYKVYIGTEKRVNESLKGKKGINTGHWLGQRFYCWLFEVKH